MAFSHGKLEYPICSVLKGRRKVWNYFDPSVLVIPQKAWPLVTLLPLITLITLITLILN
jgi:hypothetical protein